MEVIFIIPEQTTLTLNNDFDADFQIKNGTWPVLNSKNVRSETVGYSALQHCAHALHGWVHRQHLLSPNSLCFLLPKNGLCSFWSSVTMAMKTKEQRFVALKDFTPITNAKILKQNDVWPISFFVEKTFIKDQQLSVFSNLQIKFVIDCFNFCW